MSSSNTTDNVPNENASVSSTKINPRDSTPQRTGVTEDGYFSKELRNKRARDWNANREEGESAEKKQKKPKRKVALVFGYIGTNYQGLQVNPGCVSIEETLFNSLVKAGGVSEDNSNSLGKVKWSRASRTDKGVHAARNIVNLKMVVEDDIIEKINNNLPEDIRVFGYHRVVASFNCKNHCESRRYEYIMPTYVLDTETTAVATATESDTPANDDNNIPALVAEAAAAEASSNTEDTNDRKAKGKQRRSGGDDDDDDEEDDTAVDAIVDYGYGIVPPSMLPKFTKADVIANTNFNYRITNEKLEQLRSLLRIYEGTHDYHNFTSRGKFKNKSRARDYCKRYMRSFTVGEPFMMNGLEYIPLRVWGQSFMLHQIRKMIGTVVCVMRGVMDEETLRKSLKFHNDVILPLAPGLGLILDTVYFDGYNAKYGKTWGNLDLSVFDEQATEFKQRIYADIVQQEQKNKVCAEWTYGLRERSKIFGVGKIIPPTTTTTTTSTQSNKAAAAANAEVTTPSATTEDKETTQT